MKLGIIGSGNIGATAARLFAEAGHEVVISNSRGPETLAETVRVIGANVRAATVEEAADFGEIVLTAIPFGRFKSLPADALAGKIVIDAGNYYPDRDGVFAEIESGKITESELVARHLSKSTVVKAFNTIRADDLKTQGNKNLPLTDRRVVFVCGDDREAKKKVAALIKEIGFGAYDTGNLSGGGKAQAPGSSIYDRDLTVAEVEGVVVSSY